MYVYCKTISEISKVSNSFFQICEDEFFYSEHRFHNILTDILCEKFIQVIREMRDAQFPFLSFLPNELASARWNLFFVILDLFQNYISLYFLSKSTVEVCESHSGGAAFL